MSLPRLSACKALTKLVRTISAKQVDKEDVGYETMAVLEFKKEQQSRDFVLLVR
jgi:hypothetical protein